MIVNRTKRSLLKNKRNLWEFKRIGNVMVIQVPLGRLPPAKANEYLSIQLERFSKIKESFGVEKIVVTGYYSE